MHYVDLVALLAIAQFIFFGVQVAQARGRYGVKAPAVAGHELFERAYRVQMNTLELLVALLPLLYIAARYWPDAYVAVVGAVYLVGRLLYWRSYTRAPASRTLGFAVSMTPIMVLLLASLGALLRAGLQ
ncbi:MAG: MAPEG family protein [Thermomonas sp.]